MRATVSREAEPFTAVRRRLGGNPDTVVTSIWHNGIPSPAGHAMLIYDRRRCRPLPGPELRRRLALAQRAKLSHLEQGGWQLMFVRGEPATVYVVHAEHGRAILTPDARLVMARSLRMRQEDRESSAVGAAALAPSVPTEAAATHAA